MRSLEWGPHDDTNGFIRRDSHPHACSASPCDALHHLQESKALARYGADTRDSAFLVSNLQNHDPHKLLFLINYPISDRNKISTKSGQGATWLNMRDKDLRGA